MLKFVAVLIVTTALCACSKSSDDSGATGGPGKPARRVNWESVPQAYHPTIEDHRFLTAGYQKLNVDLFSFQDDVEVIYTADVPAGEGFVRIFKVWKESASWGSFNEYPKGNTLDVRNTGTYQCQIRIQNGAITELKGGCYVRVQIFLPANAEIETYNDGVLISRRFFPMDNATFLDAINDAPFKDDKNAVIAEYLKSYQETRKTPALTAEEMGKVVDEFSFTEEKLSALSRLHMYVTDRQNLPAMIEDQFSYFEREKAYQIVGMRKP